MSVLHLLHGWSDRDETAGQLRRRSTVPRHSAIDQPSSASVNVVRGQHLPPSTRPPSSSSTSAIIYSFIIYATRFSGLPTPSGLLTRITHMDYLHGLHLLYLGPNSTTADYPRSRTTN